MRCDDHRSDRFHCPEHQENHDRLQCEADRVRAELVSQRDSWSTGWTRRRFLSGLGAVGVAALGSQLVTTRVAYAAGPATNTVIVVFLRGGADGLRILSPHSADLGLDHLRSVRTSLVPADTEVIPLSGTGGWALNKAMRPLHEQLWASGELAFVPAVSAPGVSRSHFQAEQFLERGGSDTATTGWLDRVLGQLGPGTTFRALAEGWQAPRSMAGSQPKLSLSYLGGFEFPAWEQIRASSQTAVAELYRGIDGPLGEDVPTTLAALGTAASIRAASGVRNGAVYPDGMFSIALNDLANILRADVGLQVATVDVGGWDTHTEEAKDLDALLTHAATALSAFCTDLGPERRKRVTVVVQSEFGRRVAMNASAGADHGHGGLMWLLGGGVEGGKVHGTWRAPKTAADLDQGDIPGLNSPFDVLGELVQKRLGLGSVSTVFPGHSYAPLGLARAG